jgi:hypothetical protein
LNLVEDVRGAISQGIVESRVNGARAGERRAYSNDRNNRDDGHEREPRNLAPGAGKERLNATICVARRT